MKRAILSLILASVAFGADAKICITNPQGVERCRTITQDAWKAAGDLASGSCTTTPGTPGTPGTPEIPAVLDADGKVVTPAVPAVPAVPGVEPVTTCSYANAYDVVFQHIRGYLRDVLAQYPGPALVPLKKAVTDAQKALDVEQAKAPLSPAP